MSQILQRIGYNKVIQHYCNVPLKYYNFYVKIMLYNIIVMHLSNITTYKLQ